jgi:hypothetical protein
MRIIVSTAVSDSLDVQFIFNRSLLTDKVMVPVRIISSDDEVVIQSIVRATNRQTEVKEEQFFALQEFPKLLEQHFQSFEDPLRRLYYERRTCQYDRMQIEKSRVITDANVVRSFASIFLDEAHRTTRSYKSIRDKVSKEIFVKGHRLEPYYLAASMFYRLDTLFRLKKLEAKYKPARFHIMMAARMLASNEVIPKMHANAMGPYSDTLINIFSDQVEAEKLLAEAVEVVSNAAQDDYKRDNIRTEPFTKTVLTLTRTKWEQKTMKNQNEFDSFSLLVGKVLAVPKSVVLRRKEEY